MVFASLHLQHSNASLKADEGPLTFTLLFSLMDAQGEQVRYNTGGKGGDGT